MQPRGFEQVHGAFHVHPLVKGWFSQAGTDAGAGGQVDHLVKADGAEEGVQVASLGEVAFDGREGGLASLDGSQVLALESRVIEGVEIIEGPDLVAAGQQTLANMRANKAGAARHQEIHGADASIGRG